MPNRGTTCVLLADRHQGLTEGVRGLLETLFGAVLMVADEASLLEGVKRARPDVVIADLALGRQGGLGWLRELHRRWPEVAVIVLSLDDGDGVRRAALAAGADALVLKSAIATDLLPTLERVRVGAPTDKPRAQSRQE